MAGYSGTPLVKKLGIKEAMNVAVIGAPPGFWDELVELPEVRLVGKLTKDMDFILFFTTSDRALRMEFPKLKKSLSPSGMLWIAWPKKTSKIPSDLGENRLREIGLKAGLVDVKVCAIDDDWSGLKFVYRVQDRQLGKT